MLAVGLAERFRNFPVLVEVCVLSGNQRQLHGFVDQFKDQVISHCPPLPAAAVTALPLFSTRWCNDCPCRGLPKSSTNTTFKRVSLSVVWPHVVCPYVVGVALCGGCGLTVWPCVVGVALCGGCGLTVWPCVVGVALCKKLSAHQFTVHTSINPFLNSSLSHCLLHVLALHIQ